jgi:predicted O-methyltransferase YrrM
MVHLRSLVLLSAVLSVGAHFTDSVRAETNVNTSAAAPKLDVPYVPTPQPVVEKMLELAGVKQNDVLIDLGSGDGRIPITAAKSFGTRAIGVDINPVRIQEAESNAKKAGVEDKVTFQQQDLFKTDISQASVLTMYLLPDVNMKLRPRILSELKPGTRVVSHSFHLGSWQPDKTENIDGRTIYFWTVPDCKRPEERSPICAEQAKETRAR